MMDSTPGSLSHGRLSPGLAAPSSPLTARGPAVAAVLVISVLWRLPSLFDPPWVNDEGTYFAVAQAMAHGSRLYMDIWENKPPAVYLIYYAIYHLFGPSLTAVRLLATVSILGTTFLTFVLARSFSGTERALVGAALAGLLAGVPVLEGTTANAEVYLILCTSLGVYLALVRNRPSLAGMALGVALLFKAVAGFDALALGFWLAMHDRRSLRPYVLCLVGVVFAAVGLAALSGILSGLVRDGFLYDLGYVGHGNGGGVPWPLGVKMVILAGLTYRLRNARFPFLWLIWSAAGALFSGRLFGHYLLQPLPALCICLCIAAPVPVHPRRAVAALCGVFFSAALASAALGWGIAASGHDSILARRLQYYANFTRFALGQESRAAYQGQIDDHVNRNIRIADALKRMAPGRLLVWGNTPWIYVLSGRLPATPYTSALRQPEVPGETDTLRSSIVGGVPGEVVVIRPPAPPLGDARGGLKRRFSLARRRDAATLYVLKR